jgi:hypothetical protein
LPLLFPLFGLELPEGSVVYIPEVETDLVAQVEQIADQIRDLVVLSRLVVGFAFA